MVPRVCLGYCLGTAKWSAVLYMFFQNRQTCACKHGVELWLLLSFQSEPQGCVFNVYEEHGFMIDERLESDSPLNITLFLKRGKPCGGRI